MCTAMKYRMMRSVKLRTLYVHSVYVLAPATGVRGQSSSEILCYSCMLN